MSYFEEDIPRRPEIVAGLFREGQIITFAGPFNVGKTPLLADLATHIATGTDWCGRKVAQRPVLHFDFESSDPDYRRTFRNIANRLQVKLRVPQDVTPHLLAGSVDDPRTKILLDISSSAVMLKYLDHALTKKPDALIIFDPIEMAFPIDVLKKTSILPVYRAFRELLGKFQQAAILNTHNLRKDQRRIGNYAPPDLLLDPHTWLQEVAGSLDLINRSDVRMGVSRSDSDNVIILNGARRGEEFHPILLSPVDDDPEELAGFRSLSSPKFDIGKLLTPTQVKYWSELPDQFRFADYANNGIPKSSLSRLLKRCVSLGLLTSDGANFNKLARTYVEPMELTDDD